MILRSVVYDLTCFMKVLIMVKLALSLSTIAFLMLPSFRAQSFKSIPLSLRSVAHDLICFMKVFDFG